MTRRSQPLTVTPVTRPDGAEAPGSAAPAVGVRARSGTTASMDPVEGPPVARGLSIRDVSVQFGGLTAVRSMGLDAPAGQITGLIGPNGAGKSTTFGVCTGLVTPVSGTVHLDGVDVGSMNPSARGQQGLARTFQKVALYDSLTVEANVRAGLEASLAGRSLLGKIWEPRSERVAIAAAGERELARCGLLDVAEQQAGDLSTGQRRLVELARALAGPATVLLLDEPSSGLDEGETVRFGEILLEVVAERDLAILLVEHDMNLVSAICDRLYVLDYGALVCHGTVADVMASAAVRTAYLGSVDDA